MKTLLIIVGIGLVSLPVYILSQRHKGSVELGKVFSLESKSTIYYKNISFHFSTETVPFSKDPVTGREKYPHDIYVVDVVLNGLVSNKNSDVPKSKLYFDTSGGYQEFTLNSMRYELQLVNYKDGKGEFILKEVGPGLKDTGISKEKAI
ncbi:MAG: hypothetical protein RL094_422 [Candidatus Parcubacteria bacterium]|jgi:hypothetical protein